VARSAVAQAHPVRVEYGWEVSGRRSTAALRVGDCSPLAKVLARGPLCDVPGGAERGTDGVLTIRFAPGEWLLIDRPGTGPDHVRRMEAYPGTTAVDLTHAATLLRLRGEASAAVLAKVCALDLRRPDTAVRTLVAGITTVVIRNDRASYLLQCDRSFGQFLFDTLLDAGAEFGIDVDGIDGSDI